MGISKAKSKHEASLCRKYMDKTLGALAHWDTLKANPGSEPCSPEVFEKTLYSLPTRKEREAYYAKYSQSFVSPKSMPKELSKMHLDLLDKHDEWKKKNLPGNIDAKWHIIAAVLVAVGSGVAVWYFCFNRNSESTDPDVQVD